MKLKEKYQTFDTNIEGESFAIKESDYGTVVSMLRDKIYTDPIEACVRELISNGHDSRIRAGNNTPLVVNLTKSESFVPYFDNTTSEVFSVRDYGTGMTPEVISNVYKYLGSSDKRNSDNEIGGFGLGAKSPLAYTEMFLLTSYVNGIKYTWMVIDDKKGAGKIASFGEEATDELNGVLVEIPILAKDRDAFVAAIGKYIRFVDNVDTNLIFNFPEPLFARYDWAIYPEETSRTYTRQTDNIVLIDNVPYPLLDSSDNSVGRKYQVVLNASISDLSPNLSRERLDATDENKKFLKEAFNRIEVQLEEEIQKEMLSCNTIEELKDAFNDPFYSYIVGFPSKAIAKILGESEEDIKWFKNNTEARSKRAYVGDYYNYANADLMIFSSPNTYIRKNLKPMPNRYEALREAGHKQYYMVAPSVRHRKTAEEEEKWDRIAAKWGWPKLKDLTPDKKEAVKKEPGYPVVILSSHPRYNNFDTTKLEKNLTKAEMLVLKDSYIWVPYEYINDARSFFPGWKLNLLSFLTKKSIVLVKKNIFESISFFQEKDIDITPYAEEINKRYLGGVKRNHRSVKIFNLLFGADFSYFETIEDSYFGDFDNLPEGNAVQERLKKFIKEHEQLIDVVRQLNEEQQEYVYELYQKGK